MQKGQIFHYCSLNENMLYNSDNCAIQSFSFVVTSVKSQWHSYYKSGLQEKCFNAVTFCNVYDELL